MSVNVTSSRTNCRLGRGIGTCLRSRGIYICSCNARDASDYSCPSCTRPLTGTIRGNSYRFNVTVYNDTGNVDVAIGGRRNYHTTVY